MLSLYHVFIGLWLLIMLCLGAILNFTVVSYLLLPYSKFLSLGIHLFYMKALYVTSVGNLTLLTLHLAYRWRTLIKLD